MAPIITYSILSRTIDLLRARETPLYYSLLESYMVLINYMSKNVNDTLRMYKNDDIRMYNFNCITDTIVEVITTCNTYTLLTVHLL